MCPQVSEGFFPHIKNSFICLIDVAENFKYKHNMHNKIPVVFFILK